MNHQDLQENAAIVIITIAVAFLLATLLLYFRMELKLLAALICLLITGMVTWRIYDEESGGPIWSSILLASGIVGVIVYGAVVFLKS